jgi:hypothetical protein
MSLNFIISWKNDKWYNKRVLIWRFTLVLIKINYGQIGDQTGLFNTTNPVLYTSGNRFVRRTGTFGNRWFFHLSRRTTVIQDLLVRSQFSLVPDNRTNVNVEAWNVTCFWLSCLMYDFMLFFLFISKLVLFKPFNKIGIHVYLVKHVMVSIYSEITSWHHICCSK